MEYDHQRLKRGDRISFSQQDFYTMWITYDDQHPDQTRQQMLYAMGLKEIKMLMRPDKYIVCAVIYPHRFMKMKLKHGF
jgi:hypothetical protein